MGKEDKKEIEESQKSENEAASTSISHSTILYVLLVALVLVMGFNQYQIASLSGTQVGSGGYGSSSGGSSDSDISTGSVIPTGTPRVYGAELRISYDDVSTTNPAKADQTITKLASYDQQISLSGNELDRYISVGTQISCEYCCGADSIIFSNGQPACGCAHSYAMRGLAKYLIKYHGSEFTNDQILEELGKWKVLFFPGIHEQKAAVLREQGIEVNYINLASNRYRGIETGSSEGSMVGGC